MDTWRTGEWCLEINCDNPYNIGRDQSSERDCAESRSRMSEEDVAPGNRIKPWHSRPLRLILRTHPRSA
ncbi:MAG: hypothetical protein K9N52_01760 [Verrucomicrobia bacterium]|nr:hypothetical protein [Verrucomicrobiota bacterium]